MKSGRVDLLFGKKEKNSANLSFLNFQLFETKIMIIDEWYDVSNEYEFIFNEVAYAMRQL